MSPAPHLVPFQLFSPRTREARCAARTCFTAFPSSGKAVGTALAVLLAAFLFTLGCAVERITEVNSAPGSAATTDTWRDLRLGMVQRQLQARDIEDSRVLAAMATVPRHRFVPASERPWAYADRPLPIGYRQTISQPYIVAHMTQALEISPAATVLEIGTGSGYQAAVLAELAYEVYTIEIVPELAARAKVTLRELGYENVHVRHGDGHQGWPEHAPFDGIIVTAAPDHVPLALVDQLAINAKVVIPVGRLRQEMTVITKTEGGMIERKTIPVLFVPMMGEAVTR